MRTTMLSALFIILTVQSLQAGPPEKILEALKQKFPSAQEIKWINSYGYWNADFMLGNRKTSATFDQDGHWIMAQQDIALDDIGVSEVITSIKKDFNACEIQSITIFNCLTSGTWYYVKGTCNNSLKIKSYDYLGWPFPEI